MLKIIFIIMLSFSKNSFAMDYSVFNKHLFLEGGYSFPVYGHWADSDVGFKPAGGMKIMYVKDIDEILSVGAVSSEYWHYKNRILNMKVRIFSFAPVIFSWLGMGEKKYYGYCGAGVYQWSEPSTVGYDSSSGTEFGFRFGGGFKRNLIKNIDFGANLEWNHMFNMKGKNFNLDSINNLELSLSLVYNFK